MSKALELSATFATDPLDVYDAWISGDRHAAMTGAAATSVPRVGGEFTAWDGYISGRHLEMEPGTCVVQAWRTTEFPADAPDSRLEVLFDETPQGTRVTLVHREIPDGQSARYEAGWQEFYFDPMARYFGEGADSSPERAPIRRTKPSKKKTGAKPSKKKTGAKPSKKKTGAKPSKKKSGAKPSKKKSGAKPSKKKSGRAGAKRAKKKAGARRPG